MSCIFGDFVATHDLTYSTGDHALKLILRSEHHGIQKAITLVKNGSLKATLVLIRLFLGERSTPAVCIATVQRVSRGRSAHGIGQRGELKRLETNRLHGFA